MCCKVMANFGFGTLGGRKILLRCGPSRPTGGLQLVVLHLEIEAAQQGARLRRHDGLFILVLGEASETSDRPIRPT